MLFNSSSLVKDQAMAFTGGVADYGCFLEIPAVVQLYIRDVVGSITPNDLKFYNGDLKYDWEAGAFEIMVGGNSRDVKTGTINWNK